MPVKTYTLVAATPKTIGLDNEAQEVAVLNLSAGDWVWVTLNGVDPVADADDVYSVPPGARRVVPWGRTTGSEIRARSTGAAKIEVEWL
jgi:hypothetical protein